MRTINTGRTPGGQPPSYAVDTTFENGAWQTLVEAHCIECGKATALHWNTGGNHPDFIAKKFRGMGWQFDPYKPKRCVCPVCITGAPDIGVPRKQSKSQPPRGGFGSQTVDEYAADKSTTQEEPTDMAKSNSFTPATQPGTDTAVLRAAVAHMEADDYTGRQFTANEKARVRRLLDIHFDDQLGRYIDNYDDQRVAKETSLPWSLVAEYRELAYGPLKADPAVEAVKAEAVALRQEFVSLSNALDAMRQRIVTIEGRLTNVEAKAKKL